ncbi:MAG: glutamine-hydrolyzing carbamoyl-phosphate synthase small subunit [Nitrospinae bacterium]|nr:glutamine-hydrolyzing carbamoyl-phosphate synthase small subunit [Nitrospinota bacterium]
MAKAILVLSDGTIFEGESFGAEGETTGEVVFNTSMIGYQEILTDPSYNGQIVTMTYPLIGNYGINEEDVESVKPQAAGFIIKEGSKIFSNWRAQKSLDEYFKDYNIIGIQGIDTRALTKHIRDKGAQQGIISTIDFNPENLIKKAKESPKMIGRDLVKEVTCHEKYHWTEGGWDEKSSKFKVQNSKNKLFKVVAYDCGIKQNILRQLVDAGCDVTVVPAFTSSDKALSLNPDGIFLSNGPGDPDAVPYMAENIRGLIGKKPIFGICLGHQILCLSFGAKTYKLKFGHRGGNHPVMDLTTSKVEITAQNHGFAVDADSLPIELELTHINLNDKTVEGVKHKNLPIFSVQYHPEASPGPHDSGYLFSRFVEYMKETKSEHE